MQMYSDLFSRENDIVGTMIEICKCILICTVVKISRWYNLNWL